MRLLLPAICLLAACSGSTEEPVAPSGNDNDPEVPVDPETLDTDGDGLTGAQESELGLDPDLADTDNDGLDDGAEVTAGTDPLVKDTDKDGYNDAAEMAEATDPLDATSVIYQGGWPYNLDKDALENPTFYGGRGAVFDNDRFPDLIGVDQFGDLVHLYDFAGRGKPVVVDFSAQWCPPCNALADYLAGAENGFSYPKIREAIDNGDVFWVTMMGEDFYGNNATGTTSTEWADLHQDDRIPILAPPNPHASIHYIDLQAWPTMVWLDESMNIVAFDNQDVYLAIDALESSL